VELGQELASGTWLTAKMKTAGAVESGSEMTSMPWVVKGPSKSWKVRRRDVLIYGVSENAS
jgi:hypothetical protein